MYPRVPARQDGARRLGVVGGVRRETRGAESSMVPSPSSSAGARRAFILRCGPAMRVRRVLGPDAAVVTWNGPGSVGGRLHAAASSRRH